MLKKFILFLNLLFLAYNCNPSIKAETASDLSFFVMMGLFADRDYVGCGFSADPEEFSSLVDISTLQRTEIVEITCKAIRFDTKTEIAGMSSFTIEPSLPEGFQTKWEAGRLIISGSTAKVIEESKHTITLIGSKSVKANLSINVADSDEIRQVILRTQGMIYFPQGVSDQILIGKTIPARSPTFFPNLPSGLQYSPDTGYLSGLNQSGFAGTLVVNLSDYHGTELNQTYTFLNSSGRLTYPSQRFYVPYLTSVTFVPETRSLGNTTYSIHSGSLPTGFSMNGTNGVISGISTSSEQYTSASIRGLNASGSFLSSSFAGNAIEFRNVTVEIVVTSREKMTCNRSGKASHCQALNPFSCPASNDCYPSLAACQGKWKREFTNPCQF